jgi:hypothetical protein
MGRGCFFPTSRGEEVRLRATPTGSLFLLAKFEDLTFIK